VESAQIFGRTVPGTQEILSKSGRLTQSERLVLIVLGNQIDFGELLHKLPALTPQRVEAALQRLLSLELAYEVLIPVPSATPDQSVSDAAAQEFLKQSAADPVTVMATAEDLENSHRLIALASEDNVSPVSNETVRTSPRSARFDVPVPLGKLFPSDNVSPQALSGVDTGALEKVAQERIEADRIKRRERLAVAGQGAIVTSVVSTQPRGMEVSSQRTGSAAISKSELDADRLRRLAARRRFESSAVSTSGNGVWFSVAAVVLALGVLFFWLR
jgi:hypothetical protein